MNREMFITLIWPTLAKAIEDKVFKPRLWLPKNKNGVYVEMDYCGYDPDGVFKLEKEFHDAVIDLLIQYHVPIMDKSSTFTYIEVDLNKLNPQEIHDEQ